MKIKRRKRPFSIIFVPPGGGKPRSFRFGRKQMFFALVVAGILVALLAATISGLGRMGRFSVAAARLRSENTKLKADSQKLTQLENELGRLRELQGKLAALLTAEKKSGRRLEASSTNVFTQNLAEERPSPGSGPTLWPVRSRISREFSNEPGGHRGIDIAVREGTPVRAAGDGVVEFAGEDSVFGSMVIISHGFGISTLYGHNSKLIVARGDVVKKGQTIAYSGNSGNSTAPHLHFEITSNGRQVDPLTFLSEQ